jgi:N-hydroxyarylamine O-acetyltransferase
VWLYHALMESLGLADEMVERYLDLLGLRRELPGLAALARLTRRQVLTVRFENVSALVRRGTNPEPALPEAAERIAAWTQRSGGGVCFDMSSAMHAVLTALGYTTWRVAATVLLPDGKRGFTGGHQANVVDLDSRQYLVDTGNGAPFLDPIPLDLTTEVHHAGLGYRFGARDRPGVLVQDRRLEASWVPFFEYDTRPASSSVLRQAYLNHMTPGRSWVVDDVILNRCSEDAVHMVRGGVLTTYTAVKKESQALAGVEDYVRVAREVLELPGLPVQQAFAIRELIERES